jgi:heme/copper-type cytochrome/quinol oxidase subunit 2
LCANIVIAVVALFSGTLELQLLTDLKEGVHASESQALAAAEASDARQQLVGVFQIVIFVVSGILILTWIYRANFNAHQLGGTRMEFTPGWSIGWYFIPFSNLWKPYQAMKEIWKASRNPQDWQIQGVSPLLPWWWLFWIVSEILGHASFRMTTSAEELDELVTANIVTLVADVAGIPLSLILLVIVGKICEMQVAQHRKRV